MSLPAQFSHTTLQAIQSRFGLTEIGAPRLTLTSPMSPAPVGALRVFTGTTIHKMVYIGLTVPPIGLDSHMIFAFTPPTSPIPHFTLDAVLAGPYFAFHLDLIPRADLGANLAYLNAAFQPLTPTFDAAKSIEGLTPAHLSPRQYALMSPWMLAYRATEAAFAQIQAPVQAYLDHWASLVENGLPTEATPAGEAEHWAARDRANRAAIFDPSVDPVWHNVTRLVGAATAETLRQTLIQPDLT